MVSSEFNCSSSFLGPPPTSTPPSTIAVTQSMSSSPAILPIAVAVPAAAVIFCFIVTPHAQRERGKVIGRGVHIYIYLWSKKKFESYFRDQLTFSNVDSRTSRRIYRLALLLRAPETLSSLSKSRISIFNAHFTLLVRKMMSHNSIGKYRHLVN